MTLLQHVIQVQLRRGLTKTFLDRLQLDDEAIPLYVTGIHGTQSISCQAVQVTIGPANSLKGKRKRLTLKSQKNIEVGRSVYIVREKRHKGAYLKCVRFTEINLNKMTIILRQNAYEMIRPLEYKRGGVKPSSFQWVGRSVAHLQ